MSGVIQPLKRPSFWGPILLGILLLAVPLLGDFHFESALAAALFGAFAAGWMMAGLNHPAKPGDERDALLSVIRTIYLFGLPLFLYALSTGCLSVHGLGFWIFYPLPSVLFGGALGRLLRRVRISKARTWTMFVLAAVALVPLLIEFYTLPQLYFFNHVWGGWPGPIYDEAVTITPALLYFRMLTLLWAALFWGASDLNREVVNRWLFGLAAAGLLLSFLQLSAMGVVSPRSHLQQKLGAQSQTRHFSSYYDPSHFGSDEARYWALRQEFYLQRITDTLALPDRDKGDRIESYWYGHPWQKKALTGAKYTSYVPVWLQQDQLHIARGQMPGSLEHELVHVAAKPFGNTLLNASWNIGLVEGLAVALAGDVSPVSTVDQIVAADSTWPGSEELQDRFSFTGFYKGRSTVNYATAGSFVAWLLRTYPVDNFKEAYRTGNLVSAYPGSLDTLVAGWHRHLKIVPLDTVDRAASRRLFSMRSLFEKPCPHEVSAMYRQWDRFNHALAEKDTARALREMEQLYQKASDNDAVWSTRAWWMLQQQKPQAVLQNTAGTQITLQRGWMYADALWMANQFNRAHRVLDSLNTLVRTEAPSDSVFIHGLEVRADSLQWSLHLKATFCNQRLDNEDFRKAHPRSRARAVHHALETWDHEEVLRYGRLLNELPLPQFHFDTWLRLVGRIGFLGEKALAGRLAGQLEQRALRLRYQERLQQTRAWITFVNQSAQFQQ